MYMMSENLCDDDENDNDDDDDVGECLVQKFVEPYSKWTEVGALAYCSTTLLFWDKMNICVC